MAAGIRASGMPEAHQKLEFDERQEHESMTAKEFYEIIHGDYENVLTRIPADAAILRFLKRFPAEKTYSELLDAVERDDRAAGFEAAHKLKGIAGNLAFFELFSALTDLTEQLRPQTEAADAALVQRVSDGYDAVLRGISQLFGSGAEEAG